MDLVSGGEIHRALLAGVDPARCVYAGVGKTEGEIRRKRRNAESVLSGLFEQKIAKFENLPHDKLASYAGDLRDVRDSILQHMGDKSGRVKINPVQSSIVIAHDLSPSHTATTSTTSSKPVKSDSLRV